jgi:phosphoglycerate kinase
MCLAAIEASRPRTIQPTGAPLCGGSPARLRTPCACKLAIMETTTLDVFTDGVRFVQSRGLPDAMSVFDLAASIPGIEALPVDYGAVTIVRGDIDVPSKNGLVTDQSRLQALAPTLTALLNAGDRIVLIGHVGRDPQNTAAPVAATLEEILGFEVEFIEDWYLPDEPIISPRLISALQRSIAPKVFLLENLRRYPFETRSWKPLQPVDIAEDYRLACTLRDTVSDRFVIDCLAASNQDASSAILPLCMSYVVLGHYTRDEIVTFASETAEAGLIVFSGAKADKLNDLERILKVSGRLETILTGGSIGLSLAIASQEPSQPVRAGRALSDETYVGYLSPEWLTKAAEIVDLCRKHAIQLLTPVDYVLEDGQVASEIPDGLAQLDIGPRTRELFSAACEEYSKSFPNGVAYLNGVMGLVEDERFAAGSIAVAQAFSDMTSAGIKTYVGGGEGRRVVERYVGLDRVHHAFTAGGTILKLMRGESLGYLSSAYWANKRRSEGEPAAALLAEFSATRDLDRIIALADYLAQFHDTSGAHAILNRLGDAQMDDDDVTDAICQALVRRGFFSREGNLTFSLRPEDEMPSDARVQMAAWKGVIPARFLDHGSSVP